MHSLSTTQDSISPLSLTDSHASHIAYKQICNHSILCRLSAETLQIIRKHRAIRDKSKAMDKLRESEAKYRNLVQQLPVITYIASLEKPGKLLYVSPQISQLGYPAEDWLAGSDGLLKRVHADDLAVTIEAYAHTYEYHAPLRCEYRLVKSDGKIRWFLDEANVVRNDSGESLFLQGVLVDVTQDKETEQELSYYRQRLEELVFQRTQQLEIQCEILKTANANLDKALTELKTIHSELRHSETRFRLLLESVNEGIIGLDAKGRCSFLNHSAAALLGSSKDDMLGQDLHAMFGQLGTMAPSNGMGKSSPHNLLRDCPQASNIEIFQRKDGGHCLIEYTLYPVIQNGAIDSSVLILRDVTESQAYIRNLAYRASHDPLTELVNRCELEQRLQRILTNMHSETPEHALCFLDLDHFKNINDSCGHAAGDHVLRTFSALLTAKLRQRDTLARLGGDEFALLLEHTTLDQAYCIANELCEHIRNMHFVWENQEFALTVSVGITKLTDATDIADVLSNADTACYQAKQKGRNQIHVFSHQHLELPVSSD